jgi:signal transduction histidine kinase
MIVEHSLLQRRGHRGAQRNRRLHPGRLRRHGRRNRRSTRRLAQRLPSNCFANEGEPLVARQQVIWNLDLSPWLTPGDDLERLRLTRIGAVPMLRPGQHCGRRSPAHRSARPCKPCAPTTCCPSRYLAGRLQAARAQALMLGKLIDSERFAGVGQLANNVAQQLNNPLTVILGYSALLEESTPQDRPSRRRSHHQSKPAA